MSNVEVEVKVNGKELPTNEFVSTILWEILSGVMKSLKGADSEIRKIEISAASKE